MAPLTSAKVSNVGPYKNSESRAPSQAGSKETGRKNHKLRNILQSLDQSMESNGSSSSIVAVDIEDENAVVRFLISSRVYGYPNSDGSVMSNYRHFVYVSRVFQPISPMHIRQLKCISLRENLSGLLRTRYLASRGGVG